MLCRARALVVVNLESLLLLWQVLKTDSQRTLQETFQSLTLKVCFFQPHFDAKHMDYIKLFVSDHTAHFPVVLFLDKLPLMVIPDRNVISQTFDTTLKEAAQSNVSSHM
jgi:hypothetical protein